MIQFDEAFDIFRGGKEKIKNISIQLYYTYILRLIMFISHIFLYSIYIVYLNVYLKIFKEAHLK